MSIPIKNAEGIRRMRDACAIAAAVLAEMKARVRPGLTTYDLDQIGRDLIASHGARSACHGYRLHGSAYPAYTCISVNEEVVHGIGSLKRILRPGGRFYCDNVDLASPAGWAVFEESRLRFPPGARPAQISKCSTKPEIETFLRRAGFADVNVAGRLDFWVYGWGRKEA